MSVDGSLWRALLDEADHTTELREVSERDVLALCKKIDPALDASSDDVALLALGMALLVRLVKQSPDPEAVERNLISVMRAADMLLEHWIAKTL